MKRIITTAALLLAATFAHAEDSWTSPDKALHFGITAAGTAACTVATGRTEACAWAGVAVAVVKEAYDAQHRDKHTPSAKDFIAGSAGAYLGAMFGAELRGWMIRPTRGGVAVAYNTAF